MCPTRGRPQRGRVGMYGGWEHWPGRRRRSKTGKKKAGNTNNTKGDGGKTALSTVVGFVTRYCNCNELQRENSSPLSPIFTCAHRVGPNLRFTPKLVWACHAGSYLLRTHKKTAYKIGSYFNKDGSMRVRNEDIRLGGTERERKEQKTSTMTLLLDFICCWSKQTK